MRKSPFLSLLIIIPASVAALDYTDVSGRYADAPFNVPESAAISLLTNRGVVSGNPDGTFAANSTLNRAEFLKIALLSNPEVTVGPSNSEDCFPDVRKNDWFSRFVCHSKAAGIVKGYPDGFFHPDRSVNYAEALKILTVVFGYETAPAPDEPWYMPYARAAQKRGTALPIGLAFDGLLTRGQMARLASAFIAEINSDLQNYRRAERGLPPADQSSAGSSSSSVSDAHVSSYGASSVPRTSSASPSALYDFPARSRFLLAGERSQPIASAMFFANLEPMIVRRAEVKLENKIDGIDSMYVVAADGTELGQIVLDKAFDSSEKTWRGALTGNYRIEKGEQKAIGVVVRIKARNQGGVSETMIEVDSLKLTVEGEWSADTIVSGTDGGPYPKHQTAMGRITSVVNAQESDGILPLGPGQQLASFTIAGSAVENVELKIEHMFFQVNKAIFVNVNNWQLGIAGSNERADCSFNPDDSAVSCSNLSDSIGILSGMSRTFRLFGDVSLAPDATAKNMQISLNRAGSTETLGAVRWTDQSGHFNWVELEEPLARGTRWK
ncbi:S-layer homology domain-containing protein [Candidatus Peregrinibacteria bacterium]|nr:S-layer homology domain-containing protein [Candidatus Peregrinibacteria bacterium]